MRFLLQRVRQACVVLMLASIIVFLVLRLVPGDPAQTYAGLEASPEVVEAVRERFGLDRSLPVQYLYWAGNALQWDLGDSYRSGIPVMQILGQTMLPTLELAAVALLLALVLGVITGVTSAQYKDRWPDRAIQAFNALAMGVPNFVLGIVLVMIFAVNLGWLPSVGRISPLVDPLGWARTIILPATALSINLAAIFSRFLRSSMVGVAELDFVRTPTSLGVSAGRVLRSYNIRNALLPLVTVVGMEFGRLMGGAIVIESVFGWPGIGRTILTAMNTSDYLVAQGALLLIIIMFIAVNLLVDLAYTWLDPRIALEEARR